MPSGNINTVLLKANLYAKWLSSGYINSPYKYEPIHPVAVSFYTPSGITVPEIINS